MQLFCKSGRFGRLRKPFSLAFGPVIEYNYKTWHPANGRYMPLTFNSQKTKLQGGLFAQADLFFFYVRSAMLYSIHATNTNTNSPDRFFHSLTIPISLGKHLLSFLHFHAGLALKKVWQSHTSTLLYGPMVGIGGNLGSLFLTLNTTLFMPTEKLIGYSHSTYANFSIQIGYNLLGLFNF